MNIAHKPWNHSSCFVFYFALLVLHYLKELIIIATSITVWKKMKKTTVKEAVSVNEEKNNLQGTFIRIQSSK